MRTVLWLTAITMWLGGAVATAAWDHDIGAATMIVGGITVGLLWAREVRT